jgi:glutathione S-transferase
MITLYTFGPSAGLPDISPFVMKAEVLLKMAGLAYRTDASGFRKAPKGKLPYIADGGEIIADSTFIRWHLERRHGVDFDRGLTGEQKAIAWAFEKMAEDNLYWVIVDLRWMDDENFDRGARNFFAAVPALMRPLVIAMVRRKVRGTLQAQGIGRHTADQKAALGCRSITAIADFLGDKPYLMGSEPCGADASLFAFVAGMLCPQFRSPVRDAAERYDNLCCYVGRMTARYYPDYAEIAGCKAAA